MKDRECRVGARVVCVSNSFSRGKIGTIYRVYRDHKDRVSGYYVHDDNGCDIGMKWSFVELWDLVQDAPETLKSGMTLSPNCICGIHRSRCDYHRFP